MHLRRRLTAPKQIGCSYRLTALTGAPGVHASAWLPEDVMERLAGSERDARRNHVGGGFAFASFAFHGLSLGRSSRRRG